MSRIANLRNPNSTLLGVLFVFVIPLIISCSPSTRSLFFDIPPSKPEPVLVEETNVKNTKTDKLSLSSGTELGTERPAIEELDNWEDVLAMLPKDYKKKADWSAAIKQRVIMPRTGSDPNSQYATAFKYDFIIAAEKPKNEGYFPHSAHTEWLGCQNCHISLYPYKRNFATMKQMRAGASCGACHGKVAFSLRQCKRCHLQR